MKKYTMPLLMLAAAALVAMVAGCDDSGESKYEQQFVLQGSMPIGWPIRVRLTHTGFIGDRYDDLAAGVTGANITIWEAQTGDTNVYSLIADTNSARGTYVAPGAFDTVKTGYDYAIRIEIDGRVITAQTAQAPSAIHLDSAAYHGTPISSWADSTDLETVRFILKPNNDNNYYELFFQQPERAAGLTALIENVEPDWWSNDDRGVSGQNGPNGSSFWAWSIRYGDHLQVPPIVLGYQGRHRVRVFSCDSAMYDYFATGFAGDGSNYPITNVNGALGVFCVYDADTAYFCLEDTEAKHYMPCRP
jgi:hypothetical protein